VLIPAIVNAVYEGEDGCNASFQIEENPNQPQEYAPTLMFNTRLVELAPAAAAPATGAVLRARHLRQAVSRPTVDAEKRVWVHPPTGNLVVETDAPGRVEILATLPTLPDGPLT
jgi:hypothetical protein